MSETPDKIEVGRTANELAAELGLAAYREALKRAKTERKEFWEAVAAELSPHCSVMRQR